jgi:hypothetical protein
MNLKSAIYEATKTQGKDTSLICWNLDSGLSASGEYTLADLDRTVDYHPSLGNWRLTPEQVQAAWDDIQASLLMEG